MIDQQARIVSLVKTELHKAALGEQIGWSVFRALTPAQGPDGQIALMPVWVVAVSLRNPLLTHDDYEFPVVIPAQLSVPPDKAFTESAHMALDKVLEMRDLEMHGPKQTLTIPGALAA